MHIHLYVFAFLCVVTTKFSVEALRIRRQATGCTEQKDAGLPCGLGSRTEPEIRYYYNSTKKSCMAFKYLGCEGNNNNYNSQTDCRDACIPLDGSVCSSGLQPYVSKDGFMLSAEDCDGLNCPEGYSCTRGTQYVFCCNKTVEEYFEEGFSPEFCSYRHGNLRSFSIQVGDFRETITADSCRDLEGMCNEDFKCVEQNPMFAKCCENRTTRTPDDVRCGFPCPLGTVEMRDENGCKECGTVDLLQQSAANCPPIDICPSHCQYVWKGLCRTCSCSPGDGEFEVLYSFRFPVPIPRQREKEILCVDLSLDSGSGEKALPLIETKVNKLVGTFSRVLYNRRYYTQLQQTTETKYSWLTSSMQLKTNRKTLGSHGSQFQPECFCSASGSGNENTGFLEISELLNPALIKDVGGVLGDLNKKLMSNDVRIGRHNGGLELIIKVYYRNQWNQLVHKEKKFNLSLVDRFDPFTNDIYSCYKVPLDFLLPNVARLS